MTGFATTEPHPDQVNTLMGKTIGSASWKFVVFYY